MLVLLLQHIAGELGYATRTIIVLSTTVGPTFVDVVLVFVQESSFISRPASAKNSERLRPESLPTVLQSVFTRKDRTRRPTVLTKVLSPLQRLLWHLLSRPLTLARN